MTKKTKSTRIDQPIVGWSVLRRAPANEIADLDPLSLRIDKREDGSWESVTTKITLTSASGTKTIYFVIGFGVVCGRMNGKPVCIERPLEFFVPAGQTAAEHQWVSATMRTLSLAARGGFLVKALADLRKVSWDRGPVWYGKNRAGKSLVHDSEVAAIAWAIQQELTKRGFLDEHGNERPLAALAARYARMRQYRDALPLDNPHIAVNAARADAVPVSTVPVVDRCPDPDCRGEMVMKDGCPTCLDCGYSKCG
ncbi:ribonucleoside-diphosphate reductase [Sinimarinibacterium thermocellulolyticum]|uniref:Ribonucleoside-diphosphate reductase n=1 Tax=Sinimarinibacterium thermocellulolyticum TaxID=3170016 RepID=A0ABV2A727_9GAMM